MTEALIIDRLVARYRLAGADRRQRARLDRVLEQVIASGLEAAVRDAGLALDEELCIRTLDVPARLRLGDGDAALVRAWSQAFAGRIRRAIDGDDDLEIVRYTSRGHAIVELAESLTRGHSTRAWAWRQLGLPFRGPVGAALLEALGDRPELTVPVLVALATRGALAEVAVTLGVAEWVGLAELALSAAGAPRAVLDDLGAIGAPRVVPDGAGIAAASPSAAANPLRVQRLADASRLGPTLARVTGARSTAVRHAVAALVILEVAPQALSSSLDEAQAVVAAMARELAGGLQASSIGEHDGAATAHDSAAPSPDAARSNDAAATSPAAGQGARDVMEAAGSELAAMHPAPVVGSHPTRARTTTSDVAPIVDREHHRATPVADDRTASTPPIAEVATRTQDAGDRPAPSRTVTTPIELPIAPQIEPSAGVGFDLRVHGATEHGGLLFLLHVVDELGVADELSRHPALATRGFRWLLHRLALALAPIVATDPAALAFAGLQPDAPVPGADEPSPSDDERHALDAIAARVIAATRDRLGEHGPAVIDLLRRSATVVADPGWFEIRMAIRSVSLEVRRAGLDLDPGYLRWLGVVVRFVYA